MANTNSQVQYKNHKTLKLYGLRLSFAHLWQPSPTYNKYGANFIISPVNNKDTWEYLWSEITNLVTETWGDSNLVNTLWNQDSLCVKSGDNYEYDGYAGNYVLKTSSKNRPTLFDQNKVQLDDPSCGIPYSGCFVNTNVNLASAVLNGRKSVLGYVNLVQFARDGEAFGVAPATADDI